MNEHELHRIVGEHDATLEAILETLKKIENRLDAGRISIPVIVGCITAVSIIVALIVEPRISARVSPLEVEIQSLRRDNGTMQRQIEVLNQRGPFKAGQ